MRAIAERLDRHAQRRAQGIPTVTVLAGPPGLGARLFQRWAESCGVAVVTVVASEWVAVSSVWMAAACAGRDLWADAARDLARELGEDAEVLLRSLRGKSRPERELVLEGTRVWTSDEAVLRRRILLEAPGPPGLLPGDDEGLRTLAALHALVGPGPALLLLGREGPNVAAQVELGALLATRVPALPLGVAIEEPLVREYLAGPETRTRALLREGLVIVEGMPEKALRERLAPLGLPSAALDRLIHDGADEELVELCACAARAEHTGALPVAEAPERPGRSEHERFLYARLESLAATAGLFELGGKAGFLFGGQEAEVDLLCPSLAIAIEIDGYHHFRDVEAYRRDRRKDLLLQQNGYLVLRFLADDVLARLEEILDTVLAAVVHRRQP
jgi:hypothetical protein